MNTDFTKQPFASRRSLAVVALAAAGLIVATMPAPDGMSGGAWAQTIIGGHSGGHSGGGGHDDGTHDDDGHSGGHSGGSGGHQGSGGQGAGQGYGAGQGHGAGAGAGQGSSGGGRPVWAGGGIPEVELGRLNVVRSPDRVLQRAYDEALASLTNEMAGFYNLSLDEAVMALSTEFGNLDYIDSPLQNLALFKDALDGTSVLNSAPQINNSTGTLMAVFLGVASDKTIPITPDTVTAVTTILGSPMTGAAASALAADAEAIRVAVLAGHG